jgi:hypothetical protein
MFKEYSLDGTHECIEEVLGDVVENFSECACFCANYFKFRGDSEDSLRHVSWMTRWNPDIIRVPASALTPCNRIYAVERESRGAGQTPKKIKVATFDVSTMVVGHIKDWPDSHQVIRGSGALDKRAMINRLNETYQGLHDDIILPESVVTGYEISNYQRLAHPLELTEGERQESKMLYSSLAFIPKSSEPVTTLPKGELLDDDNIPF